LPNGSMSLSLGTGETLTGSLNPSDGSFALTGTGRDGGDLTLTGTVTTDSLTGTLDWSGAAGNGSTNLALGRPASVTVTMSGTYVATVDDQFDSRGQPAAPKAMLLSGSQTGGTVTLRDAVTAEVLTGPIIGDVFVVFSTACTIYGHITSVNTSGQVTAFEATYDWADAASFGWGEITAGRSDGTAGVSRGTTLWNFSAALTGGTFLLPATVTVGYSNAVTVTVSGPGVVTHTARGKIYHDPDGVGSTFVARETTLALFGFWNSTVLNGGLEHQDPGVPMDAGSFTGTPQ